MLLAVGLSLWPIVLRYILSKPSLLRVFIIKECWILSGVFFFFPTSMERICGFILHFVNVVYHADWFMDAKPSLHLWSESHLIMVYNPFTVTFFSFLKYPWFTAKWPNHSSLWCAVRAPLPSTPKVIVCIQKHQTARPSHSLTLPPWEPQVCSPWLRDLFLFCG